MDLKAFFAENATWTENRKINISNRFQDAEGNPLLFEIKAISEGVNAELREKSRRRGSAKSNQSIPELQIDEYLCRLIAECTVYPDFKNTELQRSWGVTGAQNLILKMLLPGEYTALLETIQEINGFSQTITELKDEIKN